MNAINAFNTLLLPLPALPFNIGIKKLELSYAIEKIFTDLPTHKHKSDGIIFTSAIAPYKPGTCCKQIKWKPADENTVDFKLDKMGNEWVLLLWQGEDEYTKQGVLTLSEELKKEWELKPPHGCIIECRYSHDWPVLNSFICE